MLLKQIILRNAEFLEDELDVVPVVDNFFKQKKITLKQKQHIMKVNSRRERVCRFLSLVTKEFDSSTYYDIKASLPEHNGYISSRLEEEECKLFVVVMDESVVSYRLMSVSVVSYSCKKRECD